MTADFADLRQQWTAYAQSLRLWVLQVIVWLAEVTQLRELRLRAQSELRFLRKEVRQILLARMAIEILSDPPAQTRRRRAHVRVRATSRRCFHRYVLRGVRLRGVADAKRVLDHLEAHVARCVANYREGRSRRRVVLSVDDLFCAFGACKRADIPDT